MGNWSGWLSKLYDDIHISTWNNGEYMAAICSVVSLFIFTPIILIFAYKYSKRRHETKYMRYFQTRNLNLIRFWMLCNVYYVSIHISLLCVIQFYYQQSKWESYFSDFAIISFIFCLFVLRIWKLYFDYMWSMSQLDLIWKRQINRAYTNWYLSHKRLGSASFCFYVILLPFYIALNGSLYIIAWRFESEIWYAASFGSVWFLIIFICILSYKLQRCHFADNYGIQEEMSQCAHVVIVLFCVGTALYFVFDDKEIREWSISITMSVGCTLITVISTGGVIHIQDRQHRIYQRAQQQKFIDEQSDENGKQQSVESLHSPFLEEEWSKRSVTPDDSREQSSEYVIPLFTPTDISPNSFRDMKRVGDRSNQSISKSIIENTSHGRLELSQVITNSELLNVFAQFLCVEFAVESLLFIIEIVQFKRYIKESEDDCSSILGAYLSIPQHADLPMFEKMDENALATTDMYMYAIYIIDKYINTNGSHEINISGRVRKDITRKAKDMECIRLLDIDGLQVLFDDAFTEILDLLQDPLSRFSSWEEFNFYLKAIGPTAYPFFPKCRNCVRKRVCCCNGDRHSKSTRISQFQQALETQRNIH